MAIRKGSETRQMSWNRSIFFPKKDYILRITDEEIKPSNAGNPMVKLEFEICNSPLISIGDAMVDLNGVKFPKWFVTKVKKQEGDNSPEALEKASQEAFDRYNMFLRQCGIDVSAGWDDENPPSVKGKVVYALCYGKEEPAYSSRTAEQIAKGEKHGDIIKNPVDGKDVINYSPQLEQVFGIYTGELKQPF